MFSTSSPPFFPCQKVALLWSSNTPKLILDAAELQTKSMLFIASSCSQLFLQREAWTTDCTCRAWLRAQVRLEDTNPVAPNYFPSTFALQFNDIPCIHAVSPMQTALLVPFDEAVKAKTTSHRFRIMSNDFNNKRSSPPVIWTAFGHPEKIYCRHAHLSPDTIRRKQCRACDKGIFSRKFSCNPDFRDRPHEPLLTIWHWVGKVKNYLCAWKLVEQLPLHDSSLPYELWSGLRKSNCYVRLHVGQIIWRTPSCPGRNHSSQ